MNSKASTNITIQKAASNKEFLKSGFRMYVSSIRISIPLDSRWVLDTVCVPDTTKPENVGPNNTISDQAYNYIQNYLWNFQVELNKNKQEWMAQARVMNK